MLAPLHAFHPLAPAHDPAPADKPPGLIDCAGAVLLFAAVVIVALTAFGFDWRTLTDSERPLPDSSRMMVMPPLPR